MSLSASIPGLKSKARQLKRAAGTTLNEALDRVARAEGYSSWSLLVAKERTGSHAGSRAQINPGELVLVGARPGHGKTLWALRLLTEALHRGGRGWFFSLLNDAPSLDSLLASLGESSAPFGDRLRFDRSEEICAQYMIDRMCASATENSATESPATKSSATINMVAVVDCLQLLDQRRKFPELQQQVNELKAFAQRTGAIVAFISQIHSSFDQEKQRLPTARHVRLLNDLKLSVFHKLVFLHGGRSRVCSGPG